MRRLAATAALLFCALPLTAHAQATPEAATEAYFAALQTDGLAAATTFIHPEELAKFQQMLLPIFEAEAEAGQAGLREATFGPGTTMETVKNADAEQFATSFMNFIAAQANQLGGMKFESVEVLGEVKEKDMVHVVTRTAVGVGDLAISEVEVVTWRKYEDGWRTVLSGEMEGIAQQLRARMGR